MQFDCLRRRSSPLKEDQQLDEVADERWLACACAGVDQHGRGRAATAAAAATDDDDDG